MALNGWRIMWILAFFDVATQTKDQRREYSQFRKLLLENGFNQMQFSVYMRCMPTFHKAEALVNQLGTLMPSKGYCSFVYLTDKQFGMTRHFYGGIEGDCPEDKPEQLLLFD